MNPTLESGRRVWWLMAVTSVGIVSLASSAAQRGTLPHIAPVLPLHAEARRAPIPAMFLATPGGGFAARTPTTSVELEAGGRARFSGGLELSLDGARADVFPEGLEPLAAKVSFFGGNEPSKWKAGLASFGGVRYRGIYPGIDMIYRTRARLKSEFIVAPGTDPAVIRMRFTGSKSLQVGPDGVLRVTTESGELRDEHLEVFQSISGRRVNIPARFRLIEPNLADFELESYDRNSELVIDPVISYSSYLGGSRIDQITGVAVDAAGASSGCGWTDSQTFPVLSSSRGFSGSVEAFVAKISPAGALEWASFIGGSGDDRALSIGVDPQGNSYLVGYTASGNFPVLGALQVTKSGGRDVFVTKINAAGSAIVYSTFWGGSGNDQANGVAVDAYGQPYVVGETESPNFPTVFAWKSAFGGLRDAFHFKIGVNGTMSYSTFVGGSGDDRGIGVAVSDTLTPYIVGCTTSTNFPTQSPLQATNRGGQDAFVIRFLPDADNVVYSSYLGGNGGASGRPECANSIALDPFNNMYVAGVTSSTNFPHQLAVQNTLNGLSDGFITKISSDGAIIYSTYIGGSSSDVAVAVRVDAARRAYVLGYTTSRNLPLLNPIQATPGGNYDVFLLRYDVSGYPFDFGTYFGGQGSETSTALGLLPGGAAFITGVTASGNYPVLSAFQPNFGGGTDGFITKITGF